MFDWEEGSFFAEAVIEPGVENMLKYIEKARKEYFLARIAAPWSAMRQDR